MITRFVIFLNIIISAILAGTSFGILMGFNPANYSPSTYIEQQQNLVGSLNSLMVSMVILATTITLISAFLQKKNKRVFIALLLATAFFASCILISRFGNLPIQTEILRGIRLRLRTIGQSFETNGGRSMSFGQSPN